MTAHIGTLTFTRKQLITNAVISETSYAVTGDSRDEVMNQLYSQMYSEASSRDIRTSNPFKNIHVTFTLMDVSEGKRSVKDRIYATARVPASYNSIVRTMIEMFLYTLTPGYRGKFTRKTSKSWSVADLSVNSAEELLRSYLKPSELVEKV
jgi:hypothetical protein